MMIVCQRKCDMVVILNWSTQMVLSIECMTVTITIKEVSYQYENIYNSYFRAILFGLQLKTIL